MEGERCLAPTKSGGRCAWPAAKCPHHREKAAPPARDLPPRAEEADASAGTPAALLAAIRARDVRETAWEWVSWLAASSDAASRAASLLRIVAALPAAGVAAAEALREVELRALIAHGVPPRDAAEWAFAERLFSAAALAEMQRWASLLEADPLDDLQPLRRRDAAAKEVDLALPVEGEDGG